MKLLDSTFLVDYYRGADRVEEYLSAHDPRSDEDLFTTTINLKEIVVGVHLIEDDPTLADVVSDFGWVDVVPFDVEDGYHAGVLEASLRTDDSVNDDRITALAVDLLIAAVARRHDATVVTENTDDFEALGVPVERY